MRVLFDKNVPYGTRLFLEQHQVEIVEDRGWESISNGELLRTAELAGFDVLVTADQNIIYQQNLRGRRLALVVLSSNIWPIVREHGPAIRVQVESAHPGSFAFIDMPLPPKRRR